MYRYSIFSVSIQKVLLSSFYGQILDLMFYRLTFVSMIFYLSIYRTIKVLTVSTEKMFSFMNWCQIYLQMSLSCFLLAKFITWVIYSYVNRLFMKTKSLATWKLLLTVSTGKMFSFMNWCQMYLQMSLSCCLLDTFIAWVIYSYVNGLFMTTKSLVIWKLLLTVSTRKMFLFMIWCQMYLQMSLSYCLLATFIAWVMYSYVNRLIMKTKSLGTRKVLLTVSTGKMFSVMNWCQMNLQMSLSCKIFFTYIKFIIIFR